MGALIGIGALILTKTHLKGGAYLEGGAYWKEGAKSNHYVILIPANSVFSRFLCGKREINATVKSLGVDQSNADPRAGHSR